MSKKEPWSRLPCSTANTTGWPSMTRFTSSTKSDPSPGCRALYQRASCSMSVLASGCLLGAFILKLALQILEVGRLKGHGDVGMGGEFRTTGSGNASLSLIPYVRNLRKIQDGKSLRRLRTSGIGEVRWFSWICSGAANQPGGMRFCILPSSFCIPIHGGEADAVPSSTMVGT